MPRDPHRHRRIEREMQRTLSDLLRREVHDPRIGMVTLTEVRVAPDLSSARIFYSCFKPNQDLKVVQEGLDAAARFLRGQVGRLLKLRIAPELHFELDKQLQDGMRLTELIDRAIKEDGQRQDGGQDSNDKDGADAADAPDTDAAPDDTSSSAHDPQR
jgi:ribosome-binding factor A